MVSVFLAIFRNFVWDGRGWITSVIEKLFVGLLLGLALLLLLFALFLEFFDGDVGVFGPLCCSFSSFPMFVVAPVAVV